MQEDVRVVKWYWFLDCFIQAYPFAHYETPYVVRLRNINQLADPAPCFTFTHPNNGKYQLLISCSITTDDQGRNSSDWRGWFVSSI